MIRWQSLRLIKGKDYLMIADVERKIGERTLSLKEVDDLLLETSWLEEPELIRKLLAYKTATPDSMLLQEKTAEEIKAEWKTEKLPDGTLRLLSYKGKDTIVNVPEKIGKAMVSELGDYVFSVTQHRIKKEIKESRAKIKEIRMNDNIMAIGEKAFMACENLEKVRFSDSLTVIPDYAFAECKKLNTVELPKGIIVIGCRAFYGCESLEQIFIPEGVKNFSILKKDAYDWESNYIGTFMNCVNLKKVILPESIKEIPGETFYGCINLSDINIPSHLEKIGKEAFCGCKRLKSLTIPQTVISISETGEGAFKNCKKLTLHVPSESYAEQYAVNERIKYTVE